MTEAEARKLTEQIRNNISQSAKLVRKAHSGKVWKALGYSSFEGWLKGELKISRSRGYQLLLVDSVETELRQSLDLPDDFILTDREFKLINDYGVSEFVNDVEQILESATEKMDPFVGVFSVLKQLKEAAAEEKITKVGNVPDPINEDEIAENFFNAFSHDVADVIDSSVLDPNHYERMIQEISAALENIDGILEDYNKADQR